jgi:hypothetical protein
VDFKETTRVLAEKAKYQVVTHPEETQVEASGCAGTNGHDNPHDVSWREEVERKKASQCQYGKPHPGKDGGRVQAGNDRTVPELANHKVEVAIETVNAVSAAMHEEKLKEVQCVLFGTDKSKGWTQIIEKRFPPAILRSCCADPGGFVKAEEIWRLDLIYINGYVPVCEEHPGNVGTVLGAKHFAVIINGDRTQEKPLDIEGHQVLNTE